MNLIDNVTGPLADDEPTPPFPQDLTKWALFLDVDGTLLDIAPSPDAVIVRPELPGLLSSLSEALDGALALVTGREIAVIDRLFDPLKFAVGGIHGAELRFPDGERRGAPPHPDLPRIVEDLQAFARANEGILVEAKGRAVAIHYRLNPELGEAVEACVRGSVEKAESGLEVQPGKMVVEVRPGRADKGQAMIAFLDEAPYLGRMPLMIGDDWTDEAGFRVANDRGGRSIRVGRDKRLTEAHESLADPAAVIEWLSEMLIHAALMPEKN